MNIANLITISRFPMLVVVVLVLYLGGPVGQLIDVLLILILILMDTVDGVVARRRGEQTLIGSALDIAADRTVEIVLWVAYAHLGLISVAIPITVIIRGALTDAARAVALQKGKSAHTMMRTTLGHWLVASSWMRTTYSVSKVSAFLLLALTVGLRSGGYTIWPNIWTAGVVISWLALALCILRGLPVLVESADFLRSPGSEGPAPHHDR
jgi:CDP-diacylglycerol--glycerol-3-phosphate 3-phosphatidyltransferase